MNDSTSKSAPTWLPYLMLVLSVTFIGLLVYFAQNDDGSRYENVPTANEIKQAQRDRKTVTIASRPERPEPIVDVEKTEVPSVEEARAHLVDLLLRYNPEALLAGREAIELIALDAELRAYLASLPSEPDAYAEMVYELLQQEDFYVLRYRLIEGLGWMGGDRAAVLLTEHYQNRMASENLAEARRAIDALGCVDNALSYEILDGQIRNGSPKNRAHFIRALAWHSDAKRALPLFVDLAGSEPGFQNRNKAAQALKFVGSAESTRHEVESLLAEEQNPYIRQTMIGALGEYGDPASLGVLQEIVQFDTDSTTRLSAVHNIHRIGTSRAAEILEWVMQHDENERVRTDAEKKLVDLHERLAVADR